MLKQRERQTGTERTRWLQVCSSYICVLIDVIILVLSVRLREKPANDGEEKREGGWTDGRVRVHRKT